MHLEALNPVQRSFIHELGLADEEACLLYNLAPLEFRRDIAALGLLHKIQLGEAHADFDGIFPKAMEAAPAQTRHGARRHGRKFIKITGNNYYFNQFLFGMTKVYNVFLEFVVSRPTVATFQSSYAKDARIACQSCRGGCMSIVYNRSYAWR